MEGILRFGGYFGIFCRLDGIKTVWAGKTPPAASRTRTKATQLRCFHDTPVVRNQYPSTLVQQQN
eukprot:scaffold3799_cov68-Skeletonema_dohrnii-CCMP3373.AAC.3